MFKKLNVSLFFIYLYAFTGAIPYFESADKVHTQMLYLSIINISSIYYLFNYELKNPLKTLNKHITKLPVFIFFVFFLWTTLTIFPAINHQESLIQSSFYFQQFVSFLMIMVLMSLNKSSIDNTFKNIIIILLIVELSTTLLPYLLDIYEFGEPKIRALEYRGITGSLNILAFSLLIKIPFIFYYSIKSKKFNFFYFSLLIIAFYVIFSITKTRGAYLFIILIYPILTILFFINNYRLSFGKLSMGLFKPILIVILPILISVSLSNYFESRFIKSGTSIESRLGTLATAEDASVNQRLRYYKGAIESITENPIFGIGTGNWEIVATKKDWKDMEGYTVPYHAHNDFLEIAAESGIIGSILYFFIIFYVLYLLLRKLIIKLKSRNDYLIELVLIFSIFAYLFDALINFPTARPIQQINLFLLLSFSVIYLNKDVKTLNLKLKKIPFILIIILLPLSLYSSLRVYKSSIEQKTIINFYNNGLTNLDKDFVDNFEIKYPSLATTSVPLKAFKGYFYLKNNFIEESIPLLLDARKYNPYIFFSEGWLSTAYYQIGKLDSAQYYGEISYNKIPNNLLHFGHLLSAYVGRKDSLALKNLYMNHENKTEKHDELYLVGMSTIIDQDSESFALEDFDILEPTASKYVKKGYYSLKVGYKDMIDAAQNHALGEFSFEEKEFLTALDYFKNAVLLNPYEIPYQENLANTYLQLNQNIEAIEVINSIELNQKVLTNKAMYIRSLAYLSEGLNSDACPDLAKLLNESYITQNIYNSFCLELKNNLN